MMNCKSIDRIESITQSKRYSIVARTEWLDLSSLHHFMLHSGLINIESLLHKSDIASCQHLIKVAAPHQWGIKMATHYSLLNHPPNQSVKLAIEACGSQALAAGVGSTPGLGGTGFPRSSVGKSLTPLR